MKKKDGYKFYKSRGEWRWKVSRKGRIIASSTEGYKRIEGAVKNFLSIAEYFYCELGEKIEKEYGI